MNQPSAIRRAIGDPLSLFLALSALLVVIATALPSTPDWQMQPGAILGLTYVVGILILGFIAMLRRS